MFIPSVEDPHQNLSHMTRIWCICFRCRKSTPDLLHTLHSEMPQRVSGSISSGFYVDSYNNPHSGLQNPSNPDTSNPTNVSLSSAVQIGQRLAAIGDEFNRTYEKGFENKMARVLRQSIQIVSNCQNFALSLLRSVKNVTNRVDHGGTRTPGRRTLVSTRDPVTIYPNLLLLAALVAVFGLVIKLGLDD